MPALSQFDDQYRALAPFGMRASDHRDQRYLGQRADNGLDLSGIDPFTAGFDEILRSPGNADITLRVEEVAALPL